jgi:hypothetical protein
MTKLLSTSITLIPLLLLLGSCQPNGEMNHEMHTAQSQAEEITPINEIQAIGRFPYYVTWDTCLINGNTYNNVTFTYTELGLAYITGKTVRYEKDIDVTYCETTIEYSEIG